LSTNEIETSPVLSIKLLKQTATNNFQSKHLSLAGYTTRFNRRFPCFATNINLFFDINLFFQRINTDTVLSPGAITYSGRNSHPHSRCFYCQKVYDSFEAHCSRSRQISLLAVERFCTPPCSSCHQAF